jgi:Tol biopolymer transport system component
VDGKEYSMGIEAWSPDGKRFLANGDGLHLVKTDGTAPEHVTREQEGILCGHSQFSADGRKVLFLVMHKGESMTLHVADLAGGKEYALVDATNFTDLCGCWSPDGRNVAYAATPLDANGKRQGETSLFVVDVDGKDTKTVLTEKHNPGVIRLRLLDWR